MRRRLSAYGRRLTTFEWFVEDDANRVRAFRANQPALDRFPRRLWAQVAARRLRRAGPGLFLGCEPMGHLPLREEVARYALSDRIEILWLEDGDHDLKPRKNVSGFTAADHLRTLANRVADWAAGLPAA